MANTEKDDQTPVEWLVFICYRQIDGTAVAEWASQQLDGLPLPFIPEGYLEAPILTIYFDQTAPVVGDWTKVHRPALERARAMILVASPGAQHEQEGGDDWVHRELNWWIEHRDAAPIILDPTGEASRWLPATVKQRWPQAQWLLLKLREWDLLPEKDRLGLETRAVQRILGGIQVSEEKARQEDLERERQRRRRLERLTAKQTLALAALFLLTILAALTAFSEAKRAQEQHRICEIHRLAAASTNNLESNLDLALLLALEAYGTGELDVGLRSLMAALTRQPHLTTFLHAHEEFVRELAFTREGRLISRSVDKLITLGDIDGRIQSRRHWSFSPTKRKDSRPIAVSADGRWLAYSDESCVRVRNLQSEAAVEVKSPCEPENTSKDRSAKEIRSLAFGRAPEPDQLVSNKNFPILVAAWADGPIRFWNVATWDRLPLDHSYVLGSDQVLDLDIDPSGQTLAITGTSELDACSEHLHVEARADDLFDEDRRCTCVTIVDIRREQAAAGPACLAGVIISSLDFHPEGLQLASGSGDRVVRIWEAHDGELAITHQLSGHSGGITKVRFNTDGSLLASAAWDGRVAVWDTVEFQGLLELQGHRGGVLSVAFEPDGHILAAGGEDGKVILWSVTPRQGRENAILAHEDEIWGLVFSRNGNRMFSAGGDGHIKVWDTSGWGIEGWKPSSMVPEEIDAETIIGPISIDRTGRILIAGGSDGRTRFWNAETLERFAHLDIPRDPGARASARIRAIAVSPVGDIVAVGSEPDILYVKDLRIGGEYRTLKGTQALWLQFGLNGDSMVSMGVEKEITYWALDSSGIDSVRMDFAVPHPAAGGLIAVSPGGRIAIVDREKIFIYRWGSLKFETVLNLYPVPVRSVAFSPSAEQMAAGYEDGSVVIWDLNTLRPAGAPLVGHAVPVLALAFHPDGLLVSADRSGRIVFWTSDDLLDLRAVACGIANRNLSEQEWTEYLPGQSYEATCAELPFG